MPHDTPDARFPAPEHQHISWKRSVAAGAVVSFGLGIALATFSLRIGTLRSEAIAPTIVVLGAMLVVLTIAWVVASRRQREFGLFVGGPLAVVLASTMPAASLALAPHAAAAAGLLVDSAPRAPAEPTSLPLAFAGQLGTQEAPAGTRHSDRASNEPSPASFLEAAQRICVSAQHVIRLLTPTIDEDPETLRAFLEPLRRGVDVDILAWDVHAPNAAHVASDLGLPIELVHAHGRRLDTVLRRFEEDWNVESAERAVRELPSGRFAVRRYSDLPRTRLLMADPGSRDGVIVFTPILSVTPRMDQPHFVLSDLQHETTRAVAASFSRLWSRTFRRAEGALAQLS